MRPPAALSWEPNPPFPPSNRGARRSVRSEHPLQREEIGSDESGRGPCWRDNVKWWRFVSRPSLAATTSGIASMAVVEGTDIESVGNGENVETRREVEETIAGGGGRE